jgi:hypothetical protein
VFWIRDYASPKASRTSLAEVGTGRIATLRPRWSHICAWDGHELGDMDYVQPSPHERVCRFHHPQFQIWIEDLSKRKYRFEHDQEA